MAHHVIIECNLDFAHIFRDDPHFAVNLYLALGHRHINNERVLKNYGIKVLNEHHSSDCKEVVVKRNAASELLEALKDMVEEYQNSVPYNRRDSFKLEQAANIIIKAEGK